MNTEGRKLITISDSSAAASPSAATNKTPLTKLEESIAGENGAKTLEGRQMSDVRNASDSDRSTKTTPSNDASSQQALRFYARQLLQSTNHSLKGLAKTVQEKNADWKAQIKARKRNRELARDRSRLLVFSPEFQNQLYESFDASSTGLKNPAKADLIPKAAQTSARIAVDHRDQARTQAKVQPEDRGGTQRAQLVQSRIFTEEARTKAQEAEAEHRSRRRVARELTAQEECHRAEVTRLRVEKEQIENARAKTEEQARIKSEEYRQQSELTQLKATEEINRKAEEVEVERQARIKAEHEQRRAQLALVVAEAEVKRKAQAAEAEQQARVKIEEELRVVEIARIKAEEEAQRKAKAAEAEQQARIKIERELQIAEIARMKAEEEAKRKAQSVETYQQVKITVQEELQAAIARVKAEEEAKRKAQAAEVEQQTRAKAAKELQASIARVKAEEEAKRKVQRIEVEQQARVKANEELQAAIARVKAEEEAKRKAQVAETEQQARVKAEQERLAQVALRNADEVADRKAHEAYAERQARIKAEEERQQSEQARLRAEENARRIAHEVQAEQSARIKAEQELQEAKLARLAAEQATERTALEVKAEKQAKINAEQQRRQADAARVKAEEQTERSAKRAEAERQARIKAEQQSQVAEDNRLKSVEMSLEDLIKQCPCCNRVFSGEHFYCLYDASLLVDAAHAAVIVSPKSPGMSGKAVLLSAILTFFGIAILGFVAINYLPNEWWTSPRSSESKLLTNETRDESIEVGGELNGKEMQLAKPEYPPSAKSQGATGKVTIAVMVDKSGIVTSARALDGHPLLQRTALAAARRTKFSAEKLNGQHGLTSGTITYYFKHDRK